MVYAPGEWEDAERQLKAPVMEALADELSARRWEVRFLPHTLAFPSAYNGSGQSSVDPSPAQRVLRADVSLLVLAGV